MFELASLVMEGLDVGFTRLSPDLGSSVALGSGVVANVGRVTTRVGRICSIRYVASWSDRLTRGLSKVERKRTSELVKISK